MARILVVLAVFCVASASCVELENLCIYDIFDYNGITVNAFRRVNQSVTFEPMNYYLVNKLRCAVEQFKNRTNFLEVLRIQGEQ